MGTFKIGDMVYRSCARPSLKWITCPDCFGSRALTVILGDDSSVSIDCAGCARGYEPPRGVVETYEFKPGAEEIKVGGVETIQGRETRYNYNVTENSWNTVGEKDIFSTREEALAHALKLCAEHEAEQANRINTKEKATRTWAWNAHYHRKEAKRAQESLEYHTAKLNVAKVKAKEDQ